MPNLDALLDAMATGDHLHRYSVAWVDMVATGAHLGRAVLTRGDHATYDELVAEHPGAGDDPLEFRPVGLASVPAGVPNVLNTLAVRAFNELWYRKAPRSRVGIETITGFFHPLDMVGHWNRLYGRAGFLQYQFVVPFRGGRHPAFDRHDGRLVGSGELPRGPEADGPVERRHDQLPDARMDPDPGPAGRGCRVGRRCSPVWTAPSSTPAGATTSPRTPRPPPR